MLVLALAAVLSVVIGLALAVGGAVVARHRAASASDLGALAAAARSGEGARPACAAADVVVGGQPGARMTGCRLEGADALVTVEVDLGGRRGPLGPARQTARAGPAGRLG